MEIQTELLWGIFPGSLASKGRREKGLLAFKMGELGEGANALGKKPAEREVKEPRNERILWIPP